MSRHSTDALSEIIDFAVLARDKSLAGRYGEATMQVLKIGNSSGRPWTCLSASRSTSGE